LKPVWYDTQREPREGENKKVTAGEQKAGKVIDMAVHHDKLLKWLKDHSTANKCRGDLRYNWVTVGNDFDSIAGAYQMLYDEINAGVFD